MPIKMKVFLICAALAVLAKPGFSVPKCDGYWTPFYNDGNPSRSGDDHEILERLRKNHPEICANPKDIDVRLVHPLEPGEGHDYWYLGGNYIEKEKHKSPKYGFSCFGKLQKKYYKPKCKDYKVRFCCKYPEPPCPSSYAEWTKWFDRDDPSVTGDYETVSDLRKEQPKDMCERPINIQARVKSSKNPWQVTGEKVTVNRHVGFVCKRKDQKDNQCHDYEARFCCVKEPSCPPSKAYWTKWFDRDNPSVTGDYETLADLRKERPKDICDRVINVQARVKSSKDPWQITGEKVTINNHEGFYCKRKYQKDNECHDYEARFCCEKESGWTRWYSADSPSRGTGDIETIVKHRQANKNMCSNPKKIQAVTIRDHKDARKTGDVISAYDTKVGFICLNHKQRRSYQPRSYRPSICFDYKVRFYC